MSQPIVTLCQRSAVWALLAAMGCSSAQLPATQHAGEEPERPHGQQLVEIAGLLAERGDRVRAAQYYTAAQKDGVPAQQVLPKLLSLYAADGQYRLAIEESETYLRRRPNDQRIRRCLAALYVAIDAVPEAVHTYESLVQEQPRDAESHFALATLLTDAGGQRGRANAHYQTYLALAPHGPHAEEAQSRLLKDVR
jgi:tetratricopeptide (TPR) repeat protein